MILPFVATGGTILIRGCLVGAKVFDIACRTLSSSTTASAYSATDSSNSSFAVIAKPSSASLRCKALSPPGFFPATVPTQLTSTPFI